VGIHQLAKLDWIIKERRKIADKYYAAFSDIECIEMMYEPEGYFTNQQSFPLYLKPNSPINRNDFMQKMLDKRIATRRGIMTSHRETAYNTLPRYANLRLPVSEDAADNSLVIPLYVPMDNADIQMVIESVKELLS
jgi:dTDP-4-amino-4,6-dideoxygalactose transaminase